MSTDTAVSDEGYSSAQLEYLTLLILFGALFVIDLIAFSTWYLSRRLEREQVGVHPEDIEAVRGLFSVENLDQAIPAQAYKKWKAETKDAGNSAERSSTFHLCAICLQTLQEGGMVRHLPCGHIFHSNCITKWFLKKHDTCPVCRICYVPRTASSSRLSSVAEIRDPSRARESRVP